LLFSFGALYIARIWDGHCQDSTNVHSQTFVDSKLSARVSATLQSMHIQYKLDVWVAISFE